MSFIDFASPAVSLAPAPRPTLARQAARFGLRAVVVTTVAAQLAWPATRLRPLQQVDGVNVSSQTAAEATATLDRAYAAGQIDIVNQAGELLLSVPLDSPAIRLNLAEKVEAATYYPLWQRLVPFSWLGSGPSVTTTVTVLDAAALGPVSAEPADARVVQAGGHFAVIPATMGYQVSPAALTAAVESAQVVPGETVQVVVDAKTEPAEVTTAQAAQLADALNEHIANGVTIDLGGVTFTASPAVLASTIEVVKDPSSGELVAQFDASSVLNAGLRNLAGGVYRAAVDTVVTRDASGADVIVAQGGDGQQLDLEGQLDDIENLVLNGGRSHLTAAVAPTPAGTVQVFDEAGLAADLAAAYPESTYAIYAVDMADPAKTLAVNPDQVFTAASTYKLYVAYSMLLAIDEGQVTWGSELNGLTLEACFEAMIVESDNGCPYAWLTRYGFDYVDAQVDAIGATDTNIEHSNMRTTARDLAHFLTLVYQGEILSDDSRARLIDAMERQVYREGIPTGIGDEGTVADKVGFLNALLHDAGIAYTTHGDFVLVILTDNLSWEAVADMTAMILARW
ncbi:MAG: class A beta-lactamase-related serine hydrolase [Bifidobacteriaceae bacterium]|jgi:beta-lactamase class A|nr:class A beta-lactamase-related serine hydrolase [Bifidobacteriaceae bacterium]